MRKIAVFDFDGTIYKGDSLFDFIVKYYGKKLLFKSLFSMLPSLLAWKLKLKNNGEVKEKLFKKIFAGEEYKKFIAKCDSFKDFIDKNLNIEIKNRLSEHLANGDEVYIISASPAEWIYPWAWDKGIKIVLGTGLKVQNGLLTGEFSTPNCYGAEKVRRFLEVAPDFDKKDLFIYGDSAGDKELMKLSKFPLKVNKKGKIIND